MLKLLSILRKSSIYVIFKANFFNPSSAGHEIAFTVSDLRNGHGQTMIRQGVYSSLKRCCMFSWQQIFTDEVF